MVSLGRSDDLFHDFNQELKRRIEGPIKSVNVVLGPPISGKCFFATHYLGSDVLGSIIGFISLKPTKACSEYKSVEEIVEETKEVKNEEEIIEKIVKFLVNVVFPGGVKRFINTVSIDKATEMLKDAGFSDFEIEVFSDYFKGVGRVSRQLIEQLTLLKKSYGSLIIYWIPWDVDEKYSLDGDVKKAVELIKKHFRNGIRWLGGVKYIPPG
ncbi:hypothetical protein [Vulcanisaeta distributa]|uniref:hypothetical protein n=1 Tax=Vulcanisaeta distributa TaxID=164451 RepID=UPI0006CF90ED|nr:hypothetical protein [Vulcanisaeta distributa]